MIKLTVSFICFFASLISTICGCALERIPASISSRDLHTSSPAFEPCDWQSLPETKTTLFPGIRLIECEVVGQLVPEKATFEFKYSTELRGKQSNKVIDRVELETGNDGAIYYLNYAPNEGVQYSLGQWCGWFNDSIVPTQKELQPDEDGEVHVESDGGVVYRAAWNVGESPRGLAFILCGLGGLQHSSKMMGKSLLEDGWAIVYVYTVMNTPDFKSKIELSDEKQYATSAIELFKTKFCQVIAATKALRIRMENQLPSLTSLPVVLVGISAGALNTPAVYHEMKEDVDAVILIAGGANIFDIMQEGAFTKWNFTRNDGNNFTNDELRIIEIDYLNEPSRDPYHLAPTLPHDKTLIVHAKYDAVVPATSGNLLYERAGYPERWVYSGGHLGLLMSFDKHSDEIADWLNAKIN